MTQTFLEKDGKVNNRITIAIDDDSYDLVNKMKENLKVSQSEIFRKALRFYSKYGDLMDSGKDNDKKINTYLELLSGGEHIILDVDHYLSFLKFIESSPNKDKFWEDNKVIGRSHADQFNNRFENFEGAVKRLETCNFFKLVKESSNRYTLLLGSEIPKKFVKMFLEEVLNGMGFKVEIKEDLAKLRIVLKNFMI
jgi:predicted CopG family antitoxin